MYIYIDNICINYLSQMDSMGDPAGLGSSMGHLDTCDRPQRLLLQDPFSDPMEENGLEIRFLPCSTLW